MSSRSGEHPAPRQSSPLSSSKLVPIPSSGRQPLTRRPSQNPNLKLPQFHPLNFPGQSNTPLSPHSARAVHSQPRQKSGSDAQQKQCQRDMVKNASQQLPLRSARPLVSSNDNAKPTSPRLAPIGSPGDAMTPLLLERNADYMMAGSGLSTSSSHAASDRDLVEILVQKENERRQHPEARRGNLSPRLSPAISPAGGPK